MFSNCRLGARRSAQLLRPWQKRCHKSCSFSSQAGGQADGPWSMKGLEVLFKVLGGENNALLKMLGYNSNRFDNTAVSNEDQSEQDLEQHVLENLVVTTHAKEEVSFLNTSSELIKSLDSVQALLGKDLSVMSSISTLSLHYFLEECEGIKTPSWKRRRNMFKPGIKMEELETLCLYGGLAALSYATVRTAELETLINVHYNSASLLRQQTKDTSEFLSLIVKEMNNIKDENNSQSSNQASSTWKVVKNSPIAFPSKPAHFVMTRELASGETECIILIRGTNSLEDIVTDANMTYEVFLDGYAHVGMKAAGEFIAETYGEFLSKIEHNNRLKVPKNSNFFGIGEKTPAKIKLIGHSLGAGAAVTAALKLKNQDLVEDIEVVTFACPPLLNKELSEQCSGFITSVVLDDDIVPRLTTVSIKKLITELLNFEWGKYLERDVDAFLDFLQAKLPDFIPRNDVKTWGLEAKQKVLSTFVTSSEGTSPLVEISSSKNTVGTVPGKIVYLYDTGRGYTAAEIETDDLNEINFLRSMLDDHGVESYFSALKECN